jgi:hypothetical protein
MNKKNNLLFSSHIQAALIIALTTFILSYVILYQWQKDGFSIMEISVMALLTAIIIFFIIIAVNIWHVNNYRKKSIVKGINPIKKVWSVIIIAIASFTLLSLFDSLLFYFVDKSIPQSYAEGLGDLLKSSGQSTESLNEFNEMPFMLQNGIVIFIAAIIGSLISLIFIKKDGQLLGTDSNYIR